MTTSTQRLLALLTVTASAAAYAQTSYFADNNGATAGFGNVSGANWATNSSLWTTSALGNTTTSAWLNNASVPNDAILDLTSTTSTTPSINLVESVLHVRNITVQNYNVANTGALGISTSGALTGTNSRTIQFGAGATLNIANNVNSVSDVSLRAFTTNTADTNNTVTLNGGFTKTGNGTLALVAQTSSTSAFQQTATLNVNGLIAISEGTVVLRADGVGANTTRTVNVSNATFDVASGALLSVSNQLSYSSPTPTNFTVDVLGLRGSGTVRGDGLTSGGVLTWRPNYVTPGTAGTIGTLTIADQPSGIGNSFNSSSAVASTAFSFASVVPGGLSFDLGAPGTSDTLAFSSLSSVVLGGLGFSSFTFNTLPGFDNGTYTLATGLTSTSGSYGVLHGTIGSSFIGTISQVGTDLQLTVIPEPSTYAGLAGAAALLLAVLRRRRA